MLCIHYLVWGIVLEIRNEITKKIQRKEIPRRNLQPSVVKMKFDNRQQYNNTQETARARQIKFVDKRIDVLKLSTLLAQVIYILILLVNVERQLD